MAARRKPKASSPAAGDALARAQASMQDRIGSLRGHAEDTWDNLEALFQSRVQKALKQLGVPNADEVRLLTRRVAELSAAVEKLAAVRPKPGRRAAVRKR